MLAFNKPPRSADFEDCFSGHNAFPEKSPLELAKIAVASSPRWFRVLFSIRQKLASLVGLRSETEEGINPGVGFLFSLPVLQNDDIAYEAGLADKHLDFTLKIEKDAQQIHLTTQVWYNNIAGRIYLMIVMPFHKLIVSHWVKVLSTNQNGKSRGII